jgi:hypothetical protein
MAVAEDTKVMTAVEDLKEGDILDLAGDSYADEDDFGDFNYEYAVVQHVNTYEAWGRQATSVEFLHDGMECVVAFRTGHLVPVVIGDETSA